MSDNKINLYGHHEGSRTPSKSDCLDFTNKKRVNVFPCVILIRFNNWNDYSYYTNFEAFYLAEKDNITDLGIVKIIQSNAVDLCTKLPDTFTELPKTEYFSRGTLGFYNKLNNLKIRNAILQALNDIHFYHYSKEHITKIDIDLLFPYNNSLFRDDSYDFEISSEYAKNSLDILEKINSCVDSLKTLDENNQKVILKLLYGSTITALESYLGDAFKYHVINNKNYYASFLKNYDFPKGEKAYNLKEIGLYGNAIGEFIENKVKEMMNNIIFHKVELVIKLYRDILNVDLPPTITDFQESIQKRHDVFHRNGKNIAGIDLDIKSSDVMSLIFSVKKFIGETERIISAQI